MKKQHEKKGAQKPTAAHHFLTSLFTRHKVAAHEVGKGARAFQESMRELGVSASPSELRALSRVGANDPGNAHRDLMRQLSKGSHMPHTYTAECQFWDTKANQAYIGKLNFILPFEILMVVLAMSPNGIRDWSSFSLAQAPLRARLLEWSQRMNVSFNDLLALGLWGDSAPR